MESEGSVRDLLNLLCDIPRKREQVFRGGGLGPLLAIIKNGVHIEGLNGLETRLVNADVIAIFAPAGGG
jgi:molybdopterin converting factor small subunit